MRLLITDLDNTLYDWVSYFSKSFTAMLPALSKVLETPIDELLSEFKTVHQRLGDSEAPFAALELPSVKRRFGQLDRHELKQRLAPAFEAFNLARRNTLQLYPTVASTLEELSRRGVTIVGHTEASYINAINRLSRLGIASYFKHLFALELNHPPHPNPEHVDANEQLIRQIVRKLPATERKPNPALLLDICRQEGVATADTYYIGDSLSKDIAMANACAVHSLWAKYGTRFDRSLWQLLVSITHWTDEDVRRESALKAASAIIKPEHTLESFDEILRISEGPPTAPSKQTC